MRNKETQTHLIMEHVNGDGFVNLILWCNNQCIQRSPGNSDNDDDGDGDGDDDRFGRGCNKKTE